VEFIMAANTGSHSAEPLELPLAELERQLISAYLAGAGQDLHTLLIRHDEESTRALKDASRYASEKLCEIEARSHYVHDLHGPGPR
jgi:hypothetical protein